MDPATTPRPPARAGGRHLLPVAALGLLVLCLSAAAAWFLRAHLTPRAEPRPPAGRGHAAGGSDVVRQGRLLYGAYCASCHGPEGHGDGPSAASLKAAPRDFAAGPWKYGATPAAVRRVIAEGIPGGGMPASGHALSPAELDALTAYVLTLAPRAVAARARALGPLLERAGLSPETAGGQAPDLDLLDTAGGSSSLARFRGKVVLLVFWETTCLPCLKKLPGLERLADEFHSRGVAVLAVCLDAEDAKAVRDAGSRRVKSLPLYRDARGLARLRYDVQALPAAFLIGREGRLLGGGHGPADWAGEEARALLRACLTEH
jgi:mono/diheme cytochrome c family protein/peroxiredoxin